VASIEEIRVTRLAKLQALKDAGVNPYPTKTGRDCDLAEATSKFTRLSKKKSITLAGRVVSLRPQGGLVFFTLDDGTGRFQGLIKTDEVSEAAFGLFSRTVDIGEFIATAGGRLIC